MYLGLSLLCNRRNSNELKDKVSLRPLVPQRPHAEVPCHTDLSYKRHCSLGGGREQLTPA